MRKTLTTKTSPADHLDKQSLLTHCRGGVAVMYTVLAGAIAIPALVFTSLYALSSSNSFERSTVRFDQPGTYVGGQAAGGTAGSDQAPGTLVATSGVNGTVTPNQHSPLGFQGSATPLVTTRAGTVVLPTATATPTATPTRPITIPNPIIAIPTPVATGLAALLYPTATADGTLDGNPGATPYPSNVPPKPFPSDYPTSSAPSPTAEEVNATPPFPAQEPTTDSTPPFPAQEPTTDSTPPFPAQEPEGNATPPSPGAEPGVEPADPGAPLGNTNSDGTPAEGAIPITPSAPDGDEGPPKKPNVRPKDPCKVDPDHCPDDDEPETVEPDNSVSATIGDDGEIPCNPDTDPDSCGVTFDDGFPDEPTDTTTNTTDTTNDTTNDVTDIPCDPDTHPDSCGVTFDDGFPDEPAEESEPQPGDANDITSASLILGQEILEGDNYGVGGAIVGIVISFNAGNSLAGGAAAGAQIGSLVGLLISGDEEALKDWAAAQATNYAVGQVVGTQNAGFVIAFVNDIVNENYAGALGLYLGTIACGPICGAIGEFFGSQFGGFHEEQKLKRELRDKINGLIVEVQMNVIQGVDAAVRLAAEQGLCSTVPPIHIPQPDDGGCNQHYQAGITKLNAIAACNHLVDGYIRYEGNSGEDIMLRITIRDPPDCVLQKALCGDEECPPSPPVCHKHKTTYNSLFDGSLDNLATCEEPNSTLLATTDAHKYWLETMFYGCLRDYPGNPSIYQDQALLEWHVSKIANHLVEGGGKESLEQLLQGAATAAWEQAYNEAVAKYCPQGADTPKLPRVSGN